MNLQQALKGWAPARLVSRMSQEVTKGSFVGSVEVTRNSI